MKSLIHKLILGALVCATLLASAYASASGGDLGGGGKLEKEFKLTQAEIEQLRNAANSQEAYKAWRQNLKREAREQKVMESVFNAIVLPQINR